MKVYIVAAATILVLSVFFMYQTDMDRYTRFQDVVKAAANDAADAAALYYDLASYAEGQKVFNKEEGNEVALYIIKDKLGLKDDMTFHTELLKGVCSYTIYYFDETGEMRKYVDGTLVASDTASFPFQLVEEKTGYKKSIEEPTVVVSIDAGEFSFNSAFIKDTKLVRTSGYEQKGY